MIEDYCSCEDCQDFRESRIRAKRDRALVLGDQLVHAAEYALIGGEQTDWDRLNAAVKAWREAR